MGQVRLAWNENHLREIISSKLRNESSIAILNLDGKITPAIQDYDSLKIYELTVNDLIDKCSTKFLTDYIDLIGSLSTKLNARYWWATNLASKNRFNSKIPSLLQQIEACSVAITRGLDNFIIYHPDYAIIPTLRELIPRARFGLKYSRFYVRLHLLSKRYRAMIGHLRSFLDLCHRLILIRLYYNKKFVFDTFKNTYALKTFFYESTIDENDAYSYHDPMFGRLPQFLAKNGNLFIVTHILDNYKICIDKINQHKNYTIIPVEYWLSYKAIFKSFFKLIFLRYDKSIPSFLPYRGIDVSGVFKSELFRKCNDIPQNQYIYFEMMVKCFKSQRVDQYIHTYENNPWEKMSIAAIQEISPSTKIIGFQHAVVPQASANLFNSRFEIDHMPLPNKILTVGDETQRIIEWYSEDATVDVQPACGLKYEYLFNLQTKKRTKLGNILVVLEGVREVLPMLNYVIRELGDDSDFNVTVRCHPALPYDKLKRSIKLDLSAIDNIKPSSGNSLLQDFQRNDICIYWGSTTALEALNMYIPVVHYNMQTALSYDPLFRCNFLKWSVAEEDSLKEVIEKIYAMEDIKFELQAIHARKYLREYFRPVTEDNLHKFICD